MLEEPIRLELHNIGHFAPFHIFWNDAGVAKAASDKFCRFMGLTDLHKLQESLWVLEPFVAPFNRRLFSDITNLILHVGIRSNTKQVLKGELIKIDSGWMFSGLPPARSIAELTDYGLQLSDLPLHLGIGDFLLANEAAQVSMAESAR
ncbi:MAG: hypothetical protein ACPGQS_13230, partial [Bradymonadia bacterium]